MTINLPPLIIQMEGDEQTETFRATLEGSMKTYHGESDNPFMAARQILTQLESEQEQFCHAMEEAHDAYHKKGMTLDQAANKVLEVLRDIRRRG